MKTTALILVILVLTTGASVFADTGTGTSTAGSLTANPPAAAALDSPANGATGILSSDVTWNTLDHAATYNLQVSTVSDFNTTVADETGVTATTHTLSGLSGSTKYYWHVSGTNTAGTGDYSGTWDFTTDASLAVELHSFSAELINNNILLQWTTESETGSLGFILERSDDPVETHGRASLRWQTLSTYQTHPALLGQGNTSQRTEYSYTDENIQSGRIYSYRLSDVNTDGDIHIYDIITISLPETPETTVLEPPFPNPFNPETKISYKLSDSGPVEIAVYDMLGRKVQTLVDDHQSAGSYNIYWHGKDESGMQAATGSYLIVLRTAEGVKTQKVVMVR